MGDKDRRGQQLRRDGLTATKRARFLEVLAETSSVQRTAYAAMATTGSFYRLRERDSEFDAAWKVALERGYETIEGQLLAAAQGGGSGGFDPQLALSVLKRRDGAAAGEPGFGRAARAHYVPIAEVERIVIARLRAIAKRLVARLREAFPDG